MVTGEYPPMKGGVGAFTREVCRAMAEDGHDVFVFTRTECMDAGESGIIVTGAVSGKWSQSDNRAVIDWAKQKQLDVVNIQFQTAAYDLRWPIHSLPKMLRDIAPCFVTYHDLREPYLFPKAGPFRKRAVKKLARDSAGVIATDRADEATLRNDWKIETARWIPIGSNVTAETAADYNRQIWRNEMGVGPDELLISYFGFLNESKGGVVLIEALAELVRCGVPAKLVMIGDRAGSSDPTNDAYARRVDQLVSKHQLTDRVTWTGFQEDEAVSAYFYASDVSALPYLDGVSLRRGTLMAALAHGMPIITTTPETDAPELDGVVETVEAGNPTALASAIERVWHNSDLQQQLSGHALQAHQHFGWESIAQQTIEFFRETIHQPHD